MDQLTITCDIVASNPVAPLGLEIWLDHQQLLNLEHVQEMYTFAHQVDEDENEHVLTFVLKNKQPEHTTIDSQGNILTDACVEIRNVKFSGFALEKILSECAVYTHDFNGTGTQTQDHFYGSMGCNGTVELKFTTPIYLWLLEHM